MTRPETIQTLQRRFKANTTINLMNELQEHGLISDCAVTIDDVGESELSRVERVTREEML